MNWSLVQGASPPLCTSSPNSSFQPKLTPKAPHHGLTMSEQTDCAGAVDKTLSDYLVTVWNRLSKFHYLTSCLTFFFFIPPDVEKCCTWGLRGDSHYVYMTRKPNYCQSPTMTRQQSPTKNQSWSKHPCRSTKFLNDLGVIQKVSPHYLFEALKILLYFLHQHNKRSQQMLCTLLSVHCGGCVDSAGWRVSHGWLWDATCSWKQRSIFMVVVLWHHTCPACYVGAASG